jgi:DNA-binding NarL/FixJ family response regulator
MNFCSPAQHFCAAHDRVIGTRAGMGQARLVQVAIVDEQPAFARGLAAFIADSPALSLGGHASAIDRLGWSATFSVDVLVFGIAAANETHIGQLEEHSVLHPDVAALVLTDRPTGETITACLRAGASGIAPRSLPPERLVAAVLDVARGIPFLAPEVQARVIEQFRASKASSLLTARETEVLRMLATGMTAPTIASALTLQRSTVKTHLHHLYEKLGVSDRAAAVAEGMRRGLLH